MTQTDRSRRIQLPRAAVAILDVLLLAAVVLAVIVALSGGVRARVGDVVLSARTAYRPVAAAVALLVIRRFLAGGSGPFGTRRGSARRLAARWIRVEADLPLPGHPAPSPRALLYATLGFCAVAAVMLHTQLAQMDAVPDLGDPLFSMWRIGWVQLQLHGDPRPLFDANIFHPERLTLTYSDSMLLTALLATPLAAIGLAPAVTYNLLMVGSFLLSALATWLLVARLTGSTRAAFVAGLLYGFHPFRFEHYSHLELQMTYWMPLALLALHRFVETHRLRHVLLAALCLVGQLYSSMYYGVFFPFFVTAVFGTMLAVMRLPVRRIVIPLLVAGLLAALAAAPLVGPYRAAEEAKGERPRAEIQSYSATPADYLQPHPRNAILGDPDVPVPHPERALFPGFVVIVLAVLALVPPIGFVRVSYLAGLLLAFDMSMGLNGLAYPHLYDWLSPIRGMRVPARFSIILAISLVVLAGYSVRGLLARLRSERAQRVVFGLIVAASIVDLRPVLLLRPVWPEPPAIYTTLTGRDDVVLAEFPFAIDGQIDALPQMYFSIWHGRAMVNGYSGFFPASYDPLLETISRFPEPDTLAMFRSRGVTHITVTCALLPDPDECDDLLRRADSSPAFRQIAAARWQGHPSRLYEMLP